MSTIIARSAESVHWYRQDGTPQYTVTARDGSQRPTTLRDARKMNLLPSVTTILKIMAKPGLEQWKLEQMLLAALTLPKHSGEDEKQYIARIVSDSKETARSAAEAGTRIHESIESYMAGKRDIDHYEVAFAVDRYLSEYFRMETKWLVEHSFADPSRGFAGKVDMHMSLDLAPDGIILDVKTKDFGPDDNVIGYDEHLMQLAAYRVGLGMPKARCANLFVSRTHAGHMCITEWSQEDLARGWDMFECLIRLWKLKNLF